MKYIITQEVLYPNMAMPAIVVAVLSSYKKAAEAWRVLGFKLSELGYNDVSRPIPSSSHDNCDAECSFDTGSCVYRFRRWVLEENLLPPFPFSR